MKPESVPTDLMSEKCLIGSMLWNPDAFPAIRNAIGSRSVFHDGRHVAIYGGLCALSDAGAEPTLSALAASIKAEGIERCGGEEYITGEVMDSVPGGANWPYYLRLVGECAQLRAAYLSAQQTVWLIEHKRDRAEVVAEMTAGLKAATDAIGGTPDVPIYVASASVMESLDRGIPDVHFSGIDSFDRSFGGIPKRGITTILGVPNSGKSTLALQCAAGIASTGVPTRVFSFEMNAEACTSSLLSAKATLPVHDWRRHGTRPSVQQRHTLSLAADQLNKLPISFVEEPLTHQQIAERIAVYATAESVGCVLVDYVQNVPGHPDQQDTQRIEETCRTLQRVSRKYGIAVVLVSQMTGAASREDRPPRKSDGLGSAAIDQVSDMTIGVYRPCVFQPRQPDDTDQSWEDRKRACELHVIKNRYGGLGVVDIKFEGRYTKFIDSGSSLAEEDYDRMEVPF